MLHGKWCDAIAAIINDGTKPLFTGTSSGKLNFPFFLLSVYSRCILMSPAGPNKSAMSASIICSEITII
jgi:hypothetical protein